jgi:hypothetical protein
MSVRDVEGFLLYKISLSMHNLFFADNVTSDGGEPYWKTRLNMVSFS